MTAGSAAPDAGALAVLRGAGNRAVAQVLAPASTIQRSPDQPGWGKPGTGLNQGERVVAGGTMRRIPVDGLPTHKLDAHPDYGEQSGDGGKTYRDGGANEDAKAVDKAVAGEAIVIVPTGLRTDQPVDVMVHFHGFTSRPWDPFPGYRETKAKEVRDEALDRVEEQMRAAGQSQVMAILPQGYGHSDFGDLQPDTFVAETMTRLQAIGTFERPPTQLRLILSGHSGGGQKVAAALDKEARPGEALPHRLWSEPQRRAFAKDGTVPKVPATGAGSALPVSEVVLFEALTWNQLRAVEDWIGRQLDRVVAAADKVAAVQGCPVLRAYRTGGYAETYDALHHFIKTALAERAGQLGPDEARLADHFQVRIQSGRPDHEQSVRGLGKDAASGPLADALRAHADPNAPSQLFSEKGELDHVTAAEAALDQEDADEAKRRARKAKP